MICGKTATNRIIHKGEDFVNGFPKKIRLIQKVFG